MKAVQTLKDKDPAKVMAWMKANPTDDILFGKGQVRADGRKIHEMYLFEVKKPSELKGDWDLLEAVVMIPANEAFRPLEEGGCPLVKNEATVRLAAGLSRRQPTSARATR